jgi:hypothetical protein
MSGQAATAFPHPEVHPGRRAAAKAMAAVAP